MRESSIWVNRYQDALRPVYEAFLALVKDKDYFVLTTNVDHCFQKAGFGKKRLFYTQGDYGLFQCSAPCCQRTYDNEAAVQQMLEAQGYVIGADNSLTVPDGTAPKTALPAALVPRCGRPMSMNLRCDDTFAEDEGWHGVAERYSDFLRAHKGQKLLSLELGVGYNTPAIIKYPFWQMTAENPNAVYVCINQGQASCPAALGRGDRTECQSVRYILLPHRMKCCDSVSGRKPSGGLWVCTRILPDGHFFYFAVGAAGTVEPARRL